MMPANSRIALAAELTTAAYLVAMRHCATSQWLDLQLELWRALSATLAAAETDWAARCERNAIAAGAEEFLAELAHVAYRVALPYGRGRSFLDLELELYRTMRETMAFAERRDPA